jgi:hypothetical protein
VIALFAYLWIGALIGCVLAATKDAPIRQDPPLQVLGWSVGLSVFWPLILFMIWSED